VGTGLFRPGPKRLSQQVSEFPPRDSNPVTTAAALPTLSGQRREQRSVAWARPAGPGATVKPVRAGLGCAPRIGTKWHIMAQKTALLREHRYTMRSLRGSSTGRVLSCTAGPWRPSAGPVRSAGAVVGRDVPGPPPRPPSPTDSAPAESGNSSQNRL